MILRWGSKYRKCGPCSSSIDNLTSRVLTPKILAIQHKYILHLFETVGTFRKKSSLSKQKIPNIFQNFSNFLEKFSKFFLKIDNYRVNALYKGFRFIILRIFFLHKSKNKIDIECLGHDIIHLYFSGII